MSIKTSKLLLIDLEMTDANPDNIEIIEIGLVLVDMIEQKFLRTDGYFVRPKCLENLSERCSELTGIKKEDLKKKGRPLQEVLNSIKKYYPLKSVPWGGWGSDNKQLFMECDKKGIECTFTEDYVNISVIYAFMNSLSIGIGLEKALTSYDMEFDGIQHSAKDDALNLGKLVLRMFENLS